MFLMRNVVLTDLEDLYELSGKVLFINLPHDKEIIRKKIHKSIKSFSSPSKDLADNYYIFVLEDSTKNKVIGVSMIHAQHGTEDEPHFFLRVSYENKFSTTINTGFVHGTLKLGLDTNGPTEIGGLVLHPDYRGHLDKLGKQISFVRFLYMGLNKNRFKEDILSELMPPFDKDGKAPLWEAIGRRFMNMEYREADILSRSNKEFILSLFPSDNIYMSLLPMDARDAIGNVGSDTLPVKKMLEKIGFKYTNEVDPFDGGPHFKCKLDSIKPIQELKMFRLNHSPLSGELKDLLLSITHPDYDFLAIKTQGNVKGDEVVLSSEIIEKYNIKSGSELSVIVF
jgi:arginine N-succinyltransferase